MAFLESIFLFKSLPERKALQTLFPSQSILPTKAICQTHLSLSTNLALCHLLEVGSTSKLLNCLINLFV